MMNRSDPGFAFDHDQLHRNMMYALPAGVFSATPYLLDPIIGAEIPNGYWNTDHAQAHSDFASEFPAINSISQVSINDINLEQGPDQWWQFSNWQAHNLAVSQLPSSV
jgi:hypothetical protein